MLARITRQGLVRTLHVPFANQYSRLAVGSAENDNTPRSTENAKSTKIGLMDKLKQIEDMRVNFVTHQNEAEDYRGKAEKHESEGEKHKLMLEEYQGKVVDHLNKAVEYESKAEEHANKAVEHFNKATEYNYKAGDQSKKSIKYYKALLRYYSYNGSSAKDVPGILDALSTIFGVGCLTLTGILLLDIVFY